MNTNVYYSDKEDIKNKRLHENRYYWIAYLSLFIFWLIIFILGVLYNKNNKTTIWEGLLFIIVFGVILMLFLLNSNKRNLRGVVLTSAYLDWYGTRYPLSSILYSEFVYFYNSGKFMALVYLKNNKKKIKLFREEHTADIIKLSNLIRKLKGLPEQKEIKKYGGYMGYYQWKKEIMRRIEGVVVKTLQQEG